MRTRSAPRGIAWSVRPASSVWTGRSRAGNSLICSTSLTGVRESTPTRIGWSGSKTVPVSTSQSPSSRATRSASASGSPTSCTASTSGAAASITAARAASLRS